MYLCTLKQLKKSQETITSYINNMKKQLTTLALLLLMGAGAAQAQQQCCHQGANSCSANAGKECCTTSVINNIMTRTSIRKFKQQPVEQGKVDTLLRAAMAAPTAMNRQPWHFVVVDDKQVLNELAGQGRRGDMLRNAPLAIVICGDMNKAPEGAAREFWVQDVSAATENLLLAAHAMGLGAVWTGVYPIIERAGQVAQVIGSPETIVPLCVVIVGYPDEQPTPKDKWKPENVSYNRFGGSR